MGVGAWGPGGLGVSRPPRRPAIPALPAQWVLLPCFYRYVCSTFFLSSFLNKGCSCVALPLGLDAGKLKQVGVICGQESTRRIGDYKVKYGYTDIDLLR